VNPFGLAFTLVTAALLMAAPRNWAALPLLLGAACMPNGQEIEVGPLHFSIVRLLILAGFIRVMSKGEQMTGGLTTMDRLMICWAGWLVATTVLHDGKVLITRMGEMYNAVGVYFLFRILMRDLDDIWQICRILCVLMVPLSAAMLSEKLTGKNFYSIFGFVSAETVFRHGHFRARGPFAHAITAGTVGAMCFAPALCLWKRDRKLAILGVLGAFGVVFASGSSGPIMSVLTISGALGLWLFRTKVRLFRWAGILALVVLDLMMKDPIYYLVAKIDLTGGSTGWHRAALIGSAIAHLNEWWFAGTDVTRHWMPTGNWSNDNHTDITNFYLLMGVWGGLVLMAILIAFLTVGFKTVGRFLRAHPDLPMDQQFLIWTLGAILFGHSVTFFSISYFDQSAVFLYMLLAILSVVAAIEPVTVPETVPFDSGFSPENEPSLYSNS